MYNIEMRASMNKSFIDRYFLKIYKALMIVEF